MRRVFYACRWLSIPQGLQQLKVGGRPKDGAEMEKCCIDCRFFQDAHYSRTYISPVCLAHGGDDAAFMRKYLCGIEGARLYQPRPETREGTEHAEQFKN